MKATSLACRVTKEVPLPFVKDKGGCCRMNRIEMQYWFSKCELSEPQMSIPRALLGGRDADELFTRWHRPRSAAWLG